MALQLLDTLKQAIVAYTVLSPAIFFTLLALLVAAYYVLSGLFRRYATHQRSRSLEEMKPLPPQAQPDEITEEELKQYDGSDHNKEAVPMDINTDSSAPPFSPLNRSSPYDVFLSFRGLDTRNNFTGHLYTYLDHKGVKTFMDDEELRKGEEISFALLKAIEGSKISIVIFSENYASSGWCLNELVKILECKELKQQLVWPVFYKVDPSDVRYQKGKYGETFVKHELRYRDNTEKVQKWRTALRDAANLSGCPWAFSDGQEAKFISEIAEEISAQVARRSYLHVAKYPVGMESRVQDVLKLLDVGGSDVRMVGIWGIGGIGKTTIAKAVFNSVRHKFEGWCFLVDVRAASVPHQGIAQLQNVLLYDILGGRKMEMTDPDRGIEVIKERLGGKRVLVVLDDVNELKQLDKLAGALDWFGWGSRIIITTRDKSLLISHQVNAIYTAKALVKDDARRLLTLNAFKENRNPDECLEFPIDTAVRYTQGLPLALNIIGSLLSGKGIDQWHAALDGYSKFPNNDIQRVLEISYNALEYPLKEAFLDIACFLNGKEKGYVMQALQGSYLNCNHAIEVLEEKGLISAESGYIRMHDLLEDMGREIVRKESPEDAGRRSRLWFHEDVYRVLTENTGSSKVKGIKVELPREDEIRLSAKCFKKMTNLQLFININAHFSGEVNYLPNQLRFLDWPGFPAQSLPSDFNPQNLVKLSMPNSRISGFGQGRKNFQNLKYLNFESCKLLTEVPDSIGFPNLENLNLRLCTNLAKLHPSVGFLDKLAKANLEGCYNLKIFPRIVNMRSLEYISFSGCERLENFPEFSEMMESLRYVNFSGTAIKEVPSSIGYHLSGLQFFILEHCKNLTNLPPSIYELQELCGLRLTGCRKLVLTPFAKRVKYSEVPTPTSNSNILHNGGANSSERDSDGEDGNDDDQGKLSLPKLLELRLVGCNISDYDINHFIETLGSASQLRSLDISKTNIVSIPSCLTKFTQLNTLKLHDCKRLQEVPEFPPNLVELYLGGCESLERISKLSNILKSEERQMFQWLDLTNCRRLCHNLFLEAKKEDLLECGDHQVIQVKGIICSHFLSCQKSAFQVVFPGCEIPSWFTYPTDSEGDQVFEFDIQVLSNFEWDNSGLAICFAGKEELVCVYHIRINDVIVMGRSEEDFKTVVAVDSAHVWLHYIPFNRMDMRWFGDRLPRPPFQCRVTIVSGIPSLRCGMHMVMPKNEVWMKLLRARGMKLPEDYESEYNSCSDDEIAELEPSDYDSESADSSRKEGHISRLQKLAVSELAELYWSIKWDRS